MPKFNKDEYAMNLKIRDDVRKQMKGYTKAGVEPPYWLEREEQRYDLIVKMLEHYAVEEGIDIIDVKLGIAMEDL